MKQAGVVIIVKRSLDFEPRVLAVTNRAFGGISLPGGKTNEGESVRRAAARELREETSVTVLTCDLSQLVTYPNTIREEVCMVTVFAARARWGEPRDVEQGTKHSWVTWFELLDGSPFASFYKEHFPDGVYHLRGTMNETSPAPPSET